MAPAATAPSSVLPKGGWHCSPLTWHCPDSRWVRHHPHTGPSHVWLRWERLPVHGGDLLYLPFAPKSHNVGNE